jgi:hypothetical protein
MTTSIAVRLSRWMSKHWSAVNEWGPASDVGDKEEGGDTSQMGPAPNLRQPIGQE